MKVRIMKWQALIGEMFSAIQNAYGFAGIKADPKEVDDMSSSLTKILTDSHGDLDVEQVTRAIYNGAIGNYGEYKSISVRTLYGWVRAGCPERRQNFQKNDDEPVRFKTPMQAVAERLWMIIFCYDRFINGLPYYCNARAALFTMAGCGVDYMSPEGPRIIPRPDLKVIDIDAGYVSEARTRSCETDRRKPGIVMTVSDAISSIGGYGTMEAILREQFGILKGSGVRRVYELDDDQSVYIAERRREAGI